MLRVPRPRCLALLLSIPFFAFLLVNCSSTAGGGGGAGKGLVTVKLSKASRGLHQDNIPQACTLSLSSTTLNGNCFTPLNLSAKASIISIGSSAGQGAVPARLIGLNAGPEGLGLEGPFGVLGLAAFDFATPTATTNEYSDDNIQDQTIDNVVYNLVSVSLGSLDMQFEIPEGNGDVTNRFWTIRYPYIAENPIQELAFATCPSDSGTRGVIENGGDLFSAPAAFRQGDILVCQKDAASTVCADSDFRFVSTAGALSTSRPEAPLRLSGSYFLTTPACSEGQSEHPEMIWGGTSLVLEVSNPFKITKASTGENGNYAYEFTPNCSTFNGTCSGTATTAGKITVDIAFDLGNLLFVHNDIDLTNDAETAVLRNLHRALLKPLYVANAATADGEASQSGGATAEVTITETVE